MSKIKSQSLAFVSYKNKLNFEINPKFPKKFINKFNIKIEPIFLENLKNKVKDLKIEYKTNTKTLKFQLIKLYDKCYSVLLELNEIHDIIKNGLLQKTLNKMNGNLMKILQKRNLFKFNAYESFNDEKEDCKKFLFEIEDKLIGQNWKFVARFSFLRKFHFSLLKALIFLKDQKNFDTPKFPSRNYFCNKNNENFLKNRKSDLENYFNNLIFSENYQYLMEIGNLKEFFYLLICRYCEEENEKTKIKQENRKNYFKDCKEKVILIYLFKLYIYTFFF